MGCASFDSAAWQRSVTVGEVKKEDEEGLGGSPAPRPEGRRLPPRPAFTSDSAAFPPEARIRFLNIQTLPHSSVIPKFSTLSSFSTTDSTSPSFWDSPRTGLCVLAKTRAPISPWANTDGRIGRDLGTGDEQDKGLPI